jgi:hypothetical protein
VQRAEIWFSSAYKQPSESQIAAKKRSQLAKLYTEKPLSPSLKMKKTVFSLIYLILRFCSKLFLI